MEQLFQYQWIYKVRLYIHEKYISDTSISHEDARYAIGHMEQLFQYQYKWHLDF